MNLTTLQKDNLTASCIAAEKKQGLRRGIKTTAGDTPSLLGTTSDAAQILLIEFSKFITAQSTAQSLAEMRAATDSFLPTATALIANIDAGTTKMPYQLRGLDPSIAKIESRATAVTNALFEASNA